MLMDTPDETLATAAAAGDRAAFSALILRYYDRVQGLAWRLTGNPTEAQDLAQRAYTAAPNSGPAISDSSGVSAAIRSRSFLNCAGSPE